MIKHDSTLHAPVAAGQSHPHLLSIRQLSAALPMPVRTIEKLVARGVIPALRITPRLVRYELPAVLAALRKYETATLD